MYSISDVFVVLFNLFKWYRELEGCQVDVFPVLLDYLRSCCKDYDDHFSQIGRWHLTISTVSYNIWRINISLLVIEKDEEQTRINKHSERGVEGSTVIEICHSWRRRTGWCPLASSLLVITTIIPSPPVRLFPTYKTNIWLSNYFRSCIWSYF